MGGEEKEEKEIVVESLYFFTRSMSCADRSYVSNVIVINQYHFSSLAVTDRVIRQITVLSAF